MSSGYYKIVRAIPKPRWKSRYGSEDQEGIDFFRFMGQEELPWTLVTTGTGGYGLAKIKFYFEKPIAFRWVSVGSWVGFLQTRPGEFLEILSSEKFEEMFDTSKGLWRPFEVLLFHEEDR